MMRGTVWVYDSDGTLGVRAVWTFEVKSAYDFMRRVNTAYEDGTNYTLEFGPIGPPWRKA